MLLLSEMHASELQPNIISRSSCPFPMISSLLHLLLCPDYNAALDALSPEAWAAGLWSLHGRSA